MHPRLDALPPPQRRLWPELRATPGRFVDALMRLGGVPLASMLSAAAAIHGDRYNAMLTLKALTYFDDGDLAELPAEVRKRLSQAAVRVDPTSVPRYESRPGLGASGPRRGPRVP